MKFFTAVVALAGWLTQLAAQSTLKESCDSPIYCQGELLHDVQMASLYSDSKYFVDLKLRNSEREVLAAFESLKVKYNRTIPKDELRKFVDQYFVDCPTDPTCKELEMWVPPDWKQHPSILDRISDRGYRDWANDMNGIWKNLSRKMSTTVLRDKSMTSLIYLPNGFVIPGGRFKEMYYWDNYWIIKGLLQCDMFDTVKGVIENFFDLVKKIGHIPNGSRVYYKQRSQPPMLAFMVDAYVRASRDEGFINRKTLAILDKELQYFIKNRQVTVTKNNTTFQLYRYYAPSLGPRPESYREDYILAETLSDEEKTKLYINIKSAAESGWDFSSRWFIGEKGTNRGTLADIKTEYIIPVDLNALLFGCFELMAKWSQYLGNFEKYWLYRFKAIEVATGIEKVLWNKKDGIWYDYDNLNRKPREYFYSSNFAPLWTGAYTFDRRDLSRYIINYIFKTGIHKFLGGTPQSLFDTGEQWDYPNAWAPNQAILIQGLQRLGTREAEEMAANLAAKWVYTNYRGFQTEGKMFEKYNAEKVGVGGGGGEYEAQEGFGWTNGLIFELLDYYGRYFKSTNMNRRSKPF
ncbi:trehalase (brush-border membrane glycoprotein) [Nesidiocoris tenuis]|uniref:Trehalase n=1 Tax=Nesidiocoris tenuis TaxID=355587 RepID=A0ABN7B6D5_9HEMI|nr:trehalase (brush-border membrane glycoprotein) [Nesidiocoris tenuis]